MLGTRKIMFLGLVGLLALGSTNCSKKKADDAKKKADDAKKKTFEPGKLVPFEEKQIGFSILRPENVTFSVKNDTATLGAKGFPKVTITLEKTKEISTGSGGSGRMGRYTRKVYAPMRKLVCHCADMGKYEELIKKICRSLKNTKAAPKKPSVKIEAPKITGKLKNGDAFKKALLALAPKIVDCWKKAVAADAKMPQGHLNFQLVFKADGSQKQSSISRTFNYKGHKPLTACVEKLVTSVKPTPDGGEVKLGWYMRFKLY